MATVVLQGVAKPANIGRLEPIRPTLHGERFDMTVLSLYPLRFEPIFKAALWGGNKLKSWLRWGRPPKEPTGEAWVLSDHGDQVSRIVEGPLAGRSLREILQLASEQILGRPLPPGKRFPLLLKFLDAREPLSIQVHPNDQQAARFCQPGQEARGKTEAWVVIEAEQDSQLLAGFKPGTRPESARRAIREGTLLEHLHTIRPRPGDCIYIPAGTVHALGGGVMLFEVQQTSDLTFRLHDWGRVDARTGKPRELHLDAGLACTDFSQGPCHPVQPVVSLSEPVRQEQLLGCRHFSIWRHQGQQAFTVGAMGVCRILVCLSGQGHLHHQQQQYALGPGDVLLLPACVGVCEIQPRGLITLLECGLPNE
jgi:mannose-6-phosphate isomerase